MTSTEVHNCILLHDRYLSAALIGQNGSHVSFVKIHWTLTMQYEFLLSIWISFERHGSQGTCCGLSDVLAHNSIKSFVFLNNFQKIISQQPLASGDWFYYQKICKKEKTLDMYIAFCQIYKFCCTIWQRMPQKPLFEHF